MRTNLSLFVGLRYTRAKRRNHFISFISLISMLGIALGITVLITVLSVMNGFEKELRERTLGVVSHITIHDRTGRRTDWADINSSLDQYSDIVGIAPYVSGEGMFYVGSRVNGAMIRGIQPDVEPRVSNIDNNMVEGSLTALQPGHYNIILGKALAHTLGAIVGSKVTLMIPQANITAAGIIPRLKRFTVVGIFETGTHIYDGSLALTHIKDAVTLFRIKGQFTGVRLKLEDMFAAPHLSKQIRQTLGYGYRVQDWTQQHVNFFKAVQTEKTVMFIILSLIVAVAAFNIVSTLVMMVADKRTDIAILRTLGATPRTIMGIFMVQGSLIGVIGTVLGTAGGVLLALNVENIVPALERLLHIDFLAAEVYYISDVPSDLRIQDVIKISCISLVLSILATLYPAWQASQTEPAEALRYD
ncbi:Lipoprotein releasing system transmembrane protein LolC/LolE [hydrothermal vent metagenome]|uniref:Lipoprotein releasing system transmembrane protein LolC/LolE n=1 Tax=hydrothermal vent metagenome TaxID=652676 RepID=A0A3B0ZEP4_9ZZZZ